jgi:hypothetical protein
LEAAGAECSLIGRVKKNKQKANAKKSKNQQRKGCSNNEQGESERVKH